MKMQLVGGRTLLAPVSARFLVCAIGAVVALLIGFATPAFYAMFEHHERAAALAFNAQLNAGRVVRHLHADEQRWQQERLGELMEPLEIDGERVRQRIIDTDGKVVFESGPTPAGALLRRHAPIIVNDKPVGRLEAEASLTPLLKNVAILTALSLAIGLAAYLAFRAVPLRLLDRTLGDLKAQNLRFEAALNNMTQGLCMFDAEQRVVVCNDRYARMYGLPPDHIKPGTSFREVLERRISNGIHGGEIPKERVRSLAEFAAAGKPLDRVQELTDGRVIAIKRRPMADGGWVSTHEDITEQRRSQERLAHMAHHDPLTDLANRPLFQERVSQALADRREGTAVAVLCLDLDRFKEVNDALGHAFGDELLQTVADRLRCCVREGDTVARLGGDEFAIVQGATEQPHGATALAARLLDVISAPYEISGHQILVGTSIGIAVSPLGGMDAARLVRSADLALYRAKVEGRGLYRFFDASMDARLRTRRGLEVDLRSAIANGELELHYQPIVELKRNEVSSCEALLRWNHCTRGAIAPSELISIAEDTGLIVPIGEWVLRTACHEAMKWPAHIKVAVNLSAVQFRDQSLLAAVFGALAASGLSAARLELEITESLLLQDSEAILATLHQLRALGVSISLDDFGTGYSSLSYLRSFPFDKIKIDQLFIRGMSEGAQSLAIVQAVLGLGASLGMSTIAEGVETREQLERLRAEGCSEVQGYYFSAPKPANEIPALIPTLGKPALAA